MYLNEYNGGLYIFIIYIWVYVCPIMKYACRLYTECPHKRVQLWVILSLLLLLYFI